VPRVYALLLLLTGPLRAGLPVVSPVDTGWQESPDPVTARLTAMYGAVMLTRGQPPPTIRFRDEAELAAFQASLDTATLTLAGRRLTLQAPAAAELVAARDELAAMGIRLQARGSGPAGRSYATSVANWRSRLLPALRHWVAAGKLPSAEAARIRALPDDKQIAAVLSLEERGLWCGTRLDATILASVAAPGSSQHHSLLAIDLVTGDRRLPGVLARHGWHRTVLGDTPHFTWLGVDADELPALGLVPRRHNGITYEILPPADGDGAE